MALEPSQAALGGDTRVGSSSDALAPGTLRLHNMGLLHCLARGRGELHQSD